MHPIGAMDRPVKEHISQLERLLGALNKRLMESTRNLSERNKVQSEILLASLALDYYRKAIQLEKQIS
jgi:hypothetical protein